LSETVEAFDALQRAGKIRHWGVSNFDRNDMAELWRAPHGQQVAVNQVLYNLGRRGVEWDLLPWLRAHGVATMAYSPIEQGRLLKAPQLQDFGQRHGMTPAQAALAWLLAQKDVIAIPKSATLERVRENAAARDLTLNAGQLAELDRLFAPPSGPSPLEML
jgi:aldehyde reductase